MRAVFTVQTKHRKIVLCHSTAINHCSYFPLSENHMERETLSFLTPMHMSFPLLSAWERLNVALENSYRSISALKLNYLYLIPVKNPPFNKYLKSTPKLRKSIFHNFARTSIKFLKMQTAQEYHLVNKGNNS